jgi:hypothetical protein
MSSTIFGASRVKRKKTKWYAWFDTIEVEEEGKLTATPESGIIRVGETNISHFTPHKTKPLSFLSFLPTLSSLCLTNSPYDWVW